MGTGMVLQYLHDLLLVRRSAPCAVECWLGDCGGGVESISSYWLHEKIFVVLVGRLIRDFVYIQITNFCALIIIYS